MTIFLEVWTVMGALSLWVGGLALFMMAITPTAFRSLPKEEAGRFVGLLFPAVDRWGCLWGGVTVAALLIFFLNRHFAPSSLVLEIPIGAMLLFTLHLAFNLHPEIRELRRKLHLPEFQGSAHEQTMQWTFNRLHRRSVRIHLGILILGLLSLGLLPVFLK